MKGDKVCPVCGNRTMEEHGTNQGDHHWWLCRACGTTVDDAAKDAPETAIHGVCAACMHYSEGSCTHRLSDLYGHCVRWDGCCDEYMEIEEESPLDGQFKDALEALDRMCSTLKKEGQ